MPNIKVSGILFVEDDEFDSGPNGPLTEAAFLQYTSEFSGLDDLTFEVATD